MILKDGIKHACRSCITGHRSSKCIHHDRELFPIAKKGRPSTQCKDCKHRGTPGGRCECQAKRKPKAMKVDPSLANSSGQGSSYLAEGSSSRKDSGATQFSGFHTPDDGSYSRMLGYPPGGMDGHSTRATNSSASSPSQFQQTFTINHAPLDSHAMPAGLPYPHGEAPFAYTIHNEAQGHGHADHLDPANSRLSTGVSGSRPSTSGEEDVPWWLYRAGYSPNAGLPYEPPGAGGLGAIQQEMPRVYSDYGQYLPQPSPYMLGTPGLTAAQPSPAFVWHNNATSYRDYMANQQQVSNYHPIPHASHSAQVPQLQAREEQQVAHPGMSHHNSLPNSHTSNSTESQTSGPHSAPLPRSLESDQSIPQHQRSSHDPSWASMSTESSNSGNYIASSHPHYRRTSNNIPVTQQFANIPRSEEVPALIYEGGASQMASTESLISPISSSIPSHPGYATAMHPVDRRYESKAFHYHVKHESPDTSLRERRSTSFDQVASNRASPINLTLPEDRKKRKIEVDM